MVISLKKYLELDADELKKHIGPGPEDILAAAIASYCAALTAMGESGVQACPPVGADLQRNLIRVAERLTAKQVTIPLLKENEDRVEQQLQKWGDRSAEYLKQKADEIKDILLMLTHTAESLSERNQRYSVQFSGFTVRLQQMAALEDLPQIRASLLESAAELKECVDEMEEDGRESAAKLKADVVIYQTRLEDAEHRASRDSLTGLDNRATVEGQIVRRIAKREPFCVAILDLNGFKEVNDKYGHLAGDDLLKQFGTELRSIVRSTDIVGRWGGDEFMVLLDCSYEQATGYMERQQKWLFGDYTLATPQEKLKVHLTASVGIAEWQRGETMEQVIARADAAMYKRKEEARKAAKAAKA
jgi:diguanylate cyclase